MGKIKIVVSDQQPFMIDGIIGFLGHYPDLYEVVGGYKDLKKAIAECNKSAAQIFILGEFAGGMMGSELIKWVKSHKIDAHIITFVAKMPYIDSIKLLEAGAKGCVWKTSHPAKLNRAIDSISNGYTYFDSVHMDCEKISSRYSSDNQLTNRESEILQLIADGKTNKEIANFLQLSRKTVETHRLNIMKKLDVHSGIELIETALRMGVCTI
ncbi:response regulator transcription factor [Escherichia coli]|uniref:response regulator transcription factor n=1 Tax=Escherichia coli TaxID=562 RepID=UPI00286C6BD0|nr:response regulator transcription factor [Escherichia coli]WMY53602.1 response regulator transcription factor [Escherichia coli]